LELDFSETLLDAHRKIFNQKMLWNKTNNPLEIRHAMRTTEITTEQFPVPPVKQVQVSKYKFQSVHAENASRK
jgi:hypothetical protein